jgi:hypothetical protein
LNANYFKLIYKIDAPIMAHLWEMAVSLIKSIMTFDQFFLYQIFFYYFDSFGWISILWAIMKTAVVELVMVSNRRHRLDLNGIYPNRYVL